MEAKHAPGAGMGTGLLMGILFGMLVGFSLGTARFGPAMGIPLGAAIGILMEHRKEYADRKDRRIHIAVLMIGLFLLVTGIVFFAARILSLS
ncbi:hypothetical protein JXA85_03540 [Candidatus Woesearchaeota archaeon]|nr:hypothetical protein [Candidatus Woesearchaeota archaeon]